MGRTSRSTRFLQSLALAAGASMLAASLAAAQDDADWSLRYDKDAARFVAGSADASMCEQLGAGSRLNDEGDACWYAAADLGFLEGLGLGGQARGFGAADGTDDVLVFMESRVAPEQRFDATGLEWGLIEADAGLLEGAVNAAGAVVGDGFDPAPGPRVAVFVHLTEAPVQAGDSVSLNINTSVDAEVLNDMVRSLDASFPNGGGDTNIAAGWSFIDDETVRKPAVNVWSEPTMSLSSGNVAAGPSEDPPGMWALIGPEYFSDHFNVVVVAKPLGTSMLIDRVEGTHGPLGSFALDGSTQAYLQGFTMAGTANAPGNDFELVFHTPYAPLFKGGSARIGFIMDGQVDHFSKDLGTTPGTITLGLSLPTGATGLTGVELVPAGKTKVKVANRKKPVGLKQWIKGEQLEEINAAVHEVMALSMPTRFELADGQEVQLGATPA